MMNTSTPSDCEIRNANSSFLPLRFLVLIVALSLSWNGMAQITVTAPPDTTIECDQSSHPDDLGYLMVTGGCEPWINEFHYDDASTDTLEFIEIAGPAGFDLSGWSLVLYNGATGLVYDTDALSGTIDNEAGGYGAVAFFYVVNGIQNGAPDGIALVGPGSVVQQFISYEGTFMALDGPANTMVSIDIGVSENGAEIGMSLQLNASYAWSGPSAESAGSLNTNQSLSLIPGISWTLQDVATFGNCLFEGIITRTWSATDQCGNTGSDVQIITFEDTTAPTMSCPVNVTIDPGDPTGPNNTGMPSNIDDNCSTSLGANFTDVLETNCPAAPDRIVRTWSVADDCGNVTTCVQSIWITCELLVQCEIICPPDPPIIEWPFGFNLEPVGPNIPQDPSVDPQIYGFAEGSGDCIAPIITFQDQLTMIGNCPDSVWRLSRTWILIEADGDVFQCVQTFWFSDTTDPIVDCIAITFQVEWGDPIPELPPIVTDNCGTPTVTYSDSEFFTGQCPLALIITRTWYATDNCENVSSCTQIINVTDTTPPSITCPDDVTLPDPDAPTDPAFTGFATATDNCGIPTVTYVDFPDLDNCPFETNKINRHWYATDVCGYVTTCIQFIWIPCVGVCTGDCTFQDVEGPEMMCTKPAPAVCVDHLITSSELIALGYADAADNCDPDPEIYVIDSAMVMSGCTQTWTYTFTAIDTCGNQGDTCAIIVQSLFDDEPPVITCSNPPHLGCNPVSIPTPQQVLNAGYVTATDDCGTPTIGLIPPITNTQDGCTRYRTYRFRATDICGHQSALCLVTLTWTVDTIPPMITCPEDISLQCPTDPIPAPSPTTLIVTDDCSVDYVTWVGDVSDSLTCPETITRTYEAGDSCGNVSICTQYIIIHDTIPPTITCPDIVIVECNVDTVPVTTALVDDNCTEDPFVTYYDVEYPQECDNFIFVDGYDQVMTLIVRTFYATDDCDNTVSCTQHILVRDDTPPAITCPEDVTIECTDDPNNLDLTGVPIVHDLCDPDAYATILINQIAFTSPCSTVIYRYWVATDFCANGNSGAICQQVITILDTTPPSITCPEDATIECGDELPTTLAVATDNCNAFSLTYADSAPVGTCPMVVTRTHYAEDICGNVSSCTQYIYIEDTTPPEIFCPQNTTIECGDELPPAIVEVIDICDPNVEVTYVTSAPCAVGFTGVYDFDNWFEVEPNGGTVTTDESAEVILTGPEGESCNGLSTLFGITIPADDTLMFCWHYQSSDAFGPSWDPFGYNINGTFYQLTDDNGPSVQSGVATVVVFAGDVFAFEQNSVDCIFGAGATSVVGFIDCSVSESCETIVLRTFYAEDDCGNVSSCVQCIFIDDTTAPSITCPEDLTLECNVDTIPTTLASATDVCDTDVDLTYVDAEYPQECDNGVFVDGVDQVLVLIVRTHYATDDCGNVSTCTQHIIIRDDTPPMVTCPDNVTIECDQDPNDLELTGVPIIMDLCDPEAYATILVTFPIYSSPCSTVLQRVWQATDQCGNGDSGGLCLQTITILDTTPPSITCPDDLTIQCGQEVPVTSAQATDNCNAVTLTYSDHICSSYGFTGDYAFSNWTATEPENNGDVTTIGDSEVTLTGPDGGCPGGHSTLFSIVVPTTGTIIFSWNYNSNDSGGSWFDPFGYNLNGTFHKLTVDNGPFTGALVQSGIAAVPVQAGDVFAFEQNSVDCVVGSAATTVIDFFGCSDDEEQVLGDTCHQVVIRTHYAADICNNVSSCIQLIFIDDTTPPSITCPELLTIECGDTIPVTMATATDICDDELDLTYSDSVQPDQGGCQWTIFRTHSATDDCGNVAACVQLILIIDTTPPSITCPEDITVECGQPLPVSEATATDICDEDVFVTLVGIELVIEDPCLYHIIRTYRAEDDCGLYSTCTQIITIEDTTPPSITCPDDVTIECGDPLPTTLATATDICNQLVRTYVDSAPEGTCPMVITRTHYAEDYCGNVSSCTQYITIEDTTPPSITCPSDFTVECGDLIPLVCPNVVDICDENEFVASIDGSLSQGDALMGAAFFRFGCVDDWGCDRYYDTYSFTITEAGMYVFTGLFGPELNFDPADDGMGGIFAGTFDPNDPCANYVAGSDDDKPDSFWDPLIITCELQPGEYTLVSTSYWCVNAEMDYSWTIEYSPIQVTHVDSDTTGECPMVIVRTFYAEDECGNIASCTSHIFIDDTTPPSITCPEDLTLECNVDTIPTSQATASDVCDADVDLTYVDVEYPQECGNGIFVFGVDQVLTVIVRTHYATDDCGNVSTCTQHIIIRDDTPPMVTCPEDVTIECDQDPNNLEFTGVPIVTDLCDPEAYATILVTFPIYSSPCSTVLQRVWQATDQCGNGDSGGLCVQVITILDTTPPSITCPDDLTIECGQEVPVTSAQATDNCNAVTLTYSDHICSSYGFTGDYAFSNWTATEPENNGDVTTFGDSEVILTGPDGGCVNGNSTLFSIVIPEDGTLVFAWNYSTNDSDGPAWDPFGYNVNGTFYQLTDDSGPVIQSGVAVVPVSLGDLFAFEQNSIDCGFGAGATTVIDFFGCGDDEEQVLGDTCHQVVIRTHYAADICNNVSSCVQFIFIEDTTPPTITCPALVTIECGDTIPVTMATATDICDDELDLTYSDNMLLDEGLCQWTILRTHSATDDCGNVAACVQLIVIIDTTPPSVTCPEDITVECGDQTDLIVNGGFETMDFTGWGQINTGQGGITINDGTYIPPSGDGPFPPCDGSSAAVTFQPGPGVHTLYQDVTLPADALSARLSWIDRIRNHAGVFQDPNQEFRVEVWNPSDNSVLEQLFSTNPGDQALNGCEQRSAILSSYAGQTIRIAFTEEDNLNFFEVHLDAVRLLINDVVYPTAVDICDPEVFVTLISEEVSEGNCLYTITRTFRAEDNCGLFSTCTQVITIEDTTPPTLSCPDDYTVSCEEQTCLTFDDVTVPPNGPLVNVSTFMAGGVTINVTAWTKGGVMASPVLVDTETPGLSDDDLRTPNVLYGGPGINSDDPNGFEVSNNEPRGNAIIIQTPAIPYPDDNSLSDTLVFDFSNPVFLTSLVVVDFEEPQAMSGAGAFMYDANGTLLSFVPFTGGADNNVEEVYLLQAGVSTLKVYYGSVIPGSGGIADLCFVYVPCETENAIASDLCNQVFVSCSDEANVVDECLTVITKTYTAVDACDNMSASCTQTITLETDTEQPEIVCPPDTILDCNAGIIPPPDINAVTATDNCTAEGDIIITWVADYVIEDECEELVRRIYRATDECGNSAMCAQFIYIVDLTPPEIICPADATIECGDPLPTDLATATDLCNTFTLTYVDSAPEGTCPMVVTRTHYAEDFCGNVSSCTQYITIEDTTPPSISCPENISVECGEEIPMICPMATDICTANELFTTVSGDLSQGDPLMGGAFFAGGCVDTWCDRYYDTHTLTVTETGVYTFTGLFGPETFTIDSDGMGGVFAGSFDPNNPCENFVAGSDDDSPGSILDPLIITCLLGPGEYILVSTSFWCENPEMEYTWTIEHAPILLSSVDSAPEGECPMVITRTHYAEDECGNVSSCTQYIYIEDTTPPSITCPDDVTLECNVDTIPTTLATATDICDDSLAYTYVDVEYPQECDNGVFVFGVDQVLSVIVRTHYATDDCGNVSSCTQHIIIRDDTPPMVTCPDNVTIECDQDPNDLELTGMPIVEDLCDPEAYATIVITFPIFTSPCSTVLQRVWIATDQCGNGDSGGLCVQSITILDTTPPTITCLESEIIECGDPLPTTTATATDNCQDVSVTYVDSAPEGICPMVITRTHYASDGCGNVSTCIQYFFIEDTTPPDITCPEDVTIECGDTLPAPSWIVSDVCDESPAVTYLDHVCNFLTVGFTGDYDLSNWTATEPDFGGDVTIIGTEQVILTGPNGGCPGGNSTLLSIMVPADGELVFVWNYQTQDSGGPFWDPFGYNLNGTFYQLTDDFGAVAQGGVAMVSVSAGDVFAFEQSSVDCIFGAGATTVVDFYGCTGESGYSCDQVVIRTYIATDTCGNSSACAQGIYIEDTTPPEIVCPSDLTLECDVEVPYVPPTVTDICDAEVDVTYSDEIIEQECSADVFVDGEFKVLFLIIRTHYATDDCGNTSSCTQHIIQRDDTPPQVICPPNVTVECGDPTDPDNTGWPIVTDNCDPEPMPTYVDLVGGSCPTIITRVWSATDHCGNGLSSNVCVQFITIEDTTPPSITCPSDIAVECGDPIPMICPNAVDICSDRIVVDTLSGSLDDADPLMNGAFFREGCVYPWPLGYRFYDTYTFTVTEVGMYIFSGTFGPEEGFNDDDDGMGGVFAGTFDPNNPCDNFVAGSDDDLPNSFWDPQIITCQLEPGEYTLVSTSYWGSNPAMDYSWTIEFADIQLTSVDSEPEGECPMVVTRTHYAEDECGNIASCTQHIYIFDTTPPSITCPDDVILECNVDTIPTTLATATDICDDTLALTYVDVEYPQECGNGIFVDGVDQVLTLIVRTHYATDDCGNVSTCTQHIIIRDDTPPMITCPANVTLECDQDPNDLQLTGVPIVTDLCDPEPSATIVLTFPIYSDPCSTVLSRVWAATDHCGNGTSAGLCIQLITLLDTTPPSITCPDPVTIECGDELPTTLATAIDNCNEIVYTYSDSAPAGVCPMVITRTHYASDICGNVSSCTQYIYVEDTTAPEIVCPEEITVECIEDVPAYDVNLVTATDICDDSVFVTFCGDVLITGTLYGSDVVGNYFRIDHITGIATPISVFVGIPPVTAIEYNPVDQRAHLQTAVGTDLGQEFDEVTGALIGGFIPNTPPPSSGLRSLQGMEWVGSMLYVTYTEGGGGFSPATFATLDPNTGLITNISPLGGAAPQPLSGLAYDAVSGTMYAAGGPSGLLYTVNLLTGVATPVGNMGVVLGDLEFGPDGMLYGGGGQANAGTLYSVNPNTAVATAVGPTGLGTTITGLMLVGSGGCVDIVKRTYKAVDECGNLTTCTQRIVIQDTTPPEIVCPADLTLECHLDVPETLATATDNCDENVYVTFTEEVIPQECSADVYVDGERKVLFLIVRTHYAIDDCGNISTCTQHIVLRDDTPPVVICPPNITIECDESTDPDNTGWPEVTDNCDPNPQPIYVDLAPSGNSCLSTFIRVWTATDHCGNGQSSNICIQFITIEDTTPPTITCPDDVTIECGDPLPTTLATGTDACNSVEFAYTDSEPVGNCPMVITRTHSATDSCGNASYCTQYIYLEDTTPPSITCPDNITMECGDTIPTTLATATDNCVDTVQVTYVDVEYPQDCANDLFIEGVDQVLTVIVRTHYAEDDCGNVSSCTQHIVIRDDTPPNITCPDDITIGCNDDPNDLQLTGVPIVDDICDPEAYATIIITFPVYTSPCSTVLQRVWLATDQCGNGNSGGLCSQFITILDGPPEITSCPADEELSCNELTCLTFDDFVVDGQHGPLVVVDQIIQGGVTVDITAWSKGGVQRDPVLFNTSDPHPDDLDLGTPNTLYGGPGENSDDPDGYEISNNRPLGNVLIVQTPGDTIPDDYFLSDSIVLTFSEPVFMESLVAVDFEEEQITTGAGVYLYDENGAQISFTGLLGDGNDNSLEEVSLKTAGVKKLKMYYGTSVPGSGGVGALCYVYVPCNTDSVETFDACGEVTVSCEDTTIVVSDCITEIIRTYIAEDGCGNVNDTGCVQTITLNTDNQQPDIICPADITIGCEDQVPAPDPDGVVATDNCSSDENIFVTWVEDISEGLGCAEVIRRIYSATDECGNVALCVQFITREGIPQQIVFLGQVFLQAAMNPDTIMNATLNDMGYLPHDQPYTMAPYDYWGAEHCDSMQPDIVDWVLVQLRDVVTMEVIAQKAALVKEDGSIVADDCESPVTFTATGDWYYVTVCHRNHLGIVTDVPMDCNEGWVICDFTEEHGSMEGMVEVFTGVYAMTRGDVNGDNLIKYNGSNNDKNAILSAVGILTPNNVLEGYNRYDVNMDGLVKYNGSNNDKNAILSVVGLLTPNNVIVGPLYE